MRYLLLCLGLLAACNTPGPGFRGVPATQVTVDGSVFDVRVRGNTAEAIRTNRQYAPRPGPIETRARLAISQVSGCRVSRLKGDAAVIHARLACGGQSHVPPVHPVGAVLECYEVDSYLSGATGETIASFDCAWEG